MSFPKRSGPHLLQLFFALVVLIPFTRSIAFVCSHNRQCDDGNSTTLDLCWASYSLCFNIPKVLAPNETDIFQPSTLSAITDETNLNPLSLEDKRSIISTASLFLSEVSPNRFIQLNFLNVDIVEKLSSYSEMLGTPELANETNMEFHERMKEIFQTMDDLHSTYFPPKPLGNSAATLGFRVQPFYVPGEIDENGKPRARYAIADIVPDFASRNPQFEVGAEILKWNGEDISIVVDRLGEKGYGSNPAAKRDRAVHALTFRFISFDSVPKSEKVEIELRSKEGFNFTETCKWLYFVINVPNQEGPIPGMRLPGGNLLQKPSSSKTALKDDPKLSAATTEFPEKSRTAQLTVQNRTIIEVSEPFQYDFAAEIIETKSGPIGRLILPAFEVRVSFDFAAELTRVLRLMPANGLILDARNNRGGLASHAELLTKLATGIDIDPFVETLRATNLTLELSNLPNPSPESVLQFSSAKPAIETALRAGEQHTGPVFNLFTSYDKADQGIDDSRVYFGPVVSLVNGRTYSAGDIFASLQADYNASTLIGTSDNVGGGGATTAFYSTYTRGFPDKFPPLPGDVDLFLPLSRFYRRGAFSGALIESFGIKPDVRYLSTLDDAVNEDSDLFEFLGDYLKEHSTTFVE